MGVNSLPKTVTRQRRDCDLNPGPSAPESSTLTNRLPSHPNRDETVQLNNSSEWTTLGESGTELQLSLSEVYEHISQDSGLNVC